MQGGVHVKAGGAKPFPLSDKGNAAGAKSTQASLLTIAASVGTKLTARLYTYGVNPKAPSRVGRRGVPSEPGRLFTNPDCALEPTAELSAFGRCLLAGPADLAP